MQRHRGRGRGQREAGTPADRGMLGSSDYHMVSLREGALGGRALGKLMRLLSKWAGVLGAQQGGERRNQMASHPDGPGL